MRIQKTLFAAICGAFLFPLLIMSIEWPLRDRFPILTRLDNRLTGAVSGDEAFPRFTLSSFWNRDFQSRFNTWFGRNFGGRAFLIRPSNEIDYDLFRITRMTSTKLVVGKEDYLYELGYIDDYCLPPYPPADTAKFGELARGIRAAQDRLASQGIRFMVVFTPSKAATYPEYIPEKYLARRPQNHIRKIDIFKKMVAENGIHAIDGASLTREKKSEITSITLFPRGGTHWNQLGAHFTAKAVLDLARTLGCANMPAISLGKIDIDHSPKGTDKDLAELLNLVLPPTDYPVPHIEIRTERDRQLPKPRIAMVGGSFTEQLMDAFRSTDSFEALDFYRYYASYRDYVHAPKLPYIPLNGSTDAWQASLKDMDGVWLEINEAMISMEYCESFLKDINGKADWERPKL